MGRLGREDFEGYLEDLLAGRREQCRARALVLVDHGLPVRALYEELLRDALYEVGQLWQEGRITVDTEHRATSICEDVLDDVFPLALAGERLPLSAVVSCACDELHQVGGRIVADTLEAAGWDVSFLGAGTATRALVAAVERRRPDLVGLSVSLVEHLPGVEASIRAIRDIAPGVPIALGGQAFRHGGRGLARDHAGVVIVDDLATLEALGARLAGG